MPLNVIYNRHSKFDIEDSYISIPTRFEDAKKPTAWANNKVYKADANVLAND